MPVRYARHYHDLARLANSPVAERALADVGCWRLSTVNQRVEVDEILLVDEVIDER
jgi:hypothetical protein